ncbi:MAG TPA: hypothetical protein VKT71_02945 [Candidatus Acidoferrales bacterium]|nr:hypothetical protein [Candidatus Acidoferrales bacterium]
MRSRTSIFVATVVLAICFGGQLAEMFDQWDHTVQTGDDTEYTFVVLALCVGAAYSLKWMSPADGGMDSSPKIDFYLRSPLFHPGLARHSSIAPLAASPPSSALRI